MTSAVGTQPHTHTHTHLFIGTNIHVVGKLLFILIHHLIAPFMCPGLLSVIFPNYSMPVVFNQGCFSPGEQLAA